MTAHALASTTLTDFPIVSGHFTRCWIFALHFVSSIQLLSLCQFIQFLTCTRIPHRDARCENGLVRCCLYTPPRWLVWTAVSCKRSNCNKIKKIVKVARLSLTQSRQTTGFSVLSCRFVRELICGLSVNSYELHQESLHYHQLEEERDDWCQLLILPEWHWPELSFSRFLV